MDEQPNNFTDYDIFCVECGDDFTFTSGEQGFFAAKGFTNPPKRCKPCKEEKKQRMAISEANPPVRQDTEVKCAQCGRQTTVPFVPRAGRPVYCRACFRGGAGA